MKRPFSRPTVKNKDLFIFLLRAAYHADLFDKRISARRLAYIILLICKVRKDGYSDEYLEVETLAHYIRREPDDCEDCLEKIRQVFENKFSKRNPKTPT